MPEQTEERFLPKAWLWVLGILLAMILFAGLATGIWHFFQRDKAPAHPTPPASMMVEELTPGGSHSAKRTG